MVINTSEIGDAIIDLDSAHSKLEQGGMPKVAEYVQEIIDDLREFIKAVEEV